MRKTKINRRGNKFSWSDLLGKWVYENKVAQAVIMTPSLKKVLEIFGDSILKIEAMGSKQEDEMIEKLEYLGCEIHSEGTNRAIIKYSKDYSTTNKDDDLNKGNIKKIFNLLKRYKINDCAITYLKVRLVDDNLKSIIEQLSGEKIDTNVFLIEFKSGKCDKEIHDMWDDLNGDLTRIGFKKTILNCVKLIDETSNAIFRKDYDGRWIIDWEKDMDEIISPKDICKAIAKNIDVFGKWKSYKKTAEDKLVLEGIN